MFTHYTTLFYFLHADCATTRIKMPKTTTCSGTRTFSILHVVFDMIFLAFLRSLHDNCIDNFDPKDTQLHHIQQVCTYKKWQSNYNYAK